MESEQGLSTHPDRRNRETQDLTVDSFRWVVFWTIRCPGGGQSLVMFGTFSDQKERTMKDLTPVTFYDILIARLPDRTTKVKEVISPRELGDLIKRTRWK